MTEDIAWRGQEERNEAHLTLTTEQDALVREAWERAADMRVRFDQVMRDVRDGTAREGGALAGDRSTEGIDGIDFSLKTLESLRGKVARELERYPDLEASDVLAGLKDLNRYTLLFDSDSYTRGAQKASVTLQGHGLEQVKMQNTWADPVYKGINSAWRHRESGQVIELQLHTPDSYDVKMANHNLFELTRSKALVEAYGRKESKPYTAAANQLMNDRYQQCREIDGEKQPIRIPRDHELLAKSSQRVQLDSDFTEHHVRVVRELAGEPEPPRPSQSAATRTGVPQGDKPSTSQVAALKGGSGHDLSRGHRADTANPPTKPTVGPAQQRSVKGNAHRGGPTTQQSRTAQRTPQPTQNRNQPNPKLR